MRPILRCFPALGGMLLFALLCVAMAGPRYFRNNAATLMEEQPGPTLGNYPDTSIPLSTDTTVTPDAAPTNTTRITVSTSTNFEGTLEGDPATVESVTVKLTNAQGSTSSSVTPFSSN